MNKLELVEALKQEVNLTKNEAVVVVDVFFDSIAKPLQKVTGWKSEAYARFMSSHTRPTQEETQKQANRFKLNQKNCLFLNVVKN